VFCVEPFSVLVDRVERFGVFHWNRTLLKVKVLSTVLYCSGLSYRVVAQGIRRNRGIVKGAQLEGEYHLLFFVLA